MDQVHEQFLSHGANLTISYAASICPFAYLICALIPDDYTLHNGRWEHPLCAVGGSLF